MKGKIRIKKLISTLLVLAILLSLVPITTSASTEREKVYQLLNSEIEKSTNASQTILRGDTMTVKFNSENENAKSIKVFSYNDNSTGTPSKWALSEVNAAISENLVTDKVKKNYQKNITREEFCELVVKLYEKLTKLKAAAASDVFSDTDNKEVLKAYSLGIVKGISEDKFAPKDNVTREEICTMLVRMLGKIYKDLNLKGFASESFADSYNISSWANQSIQFAYYNNIMKGVGSNKINPLGKTTCEEAILLIKRLYENRNTFEYLNKNNESLCGNDIKWELQKDGTLVISGKGKMFDYLAVTQGTPPWNDAMMNGKVKKIHIDEGVSQIGLYAFTGCRNFELFLPESLIKIGYAAFDDTKIKNVYYSGSKSAWNDIEVDARNTHIEKIDKIFNTSYKQYMSELENLGSEALDDKQDIQPDDRENKEEAQFDEIDDLYYTKVNASNFNSAVVDSNGVLWVWGNNTYGQLGVDNPDCTVPNKIMEDVKMIALGTAHTMALKNDGTLWVWGDNTDGQLGDKTTQSCAKPKKIMNNIKYIDAGGNRSYAIKKDGTLWAWGDNSAGALGLGSTETFYEPVYVTEDVRYIDASRDVLGISSFALIIKNDDSLWGCGANECENLCKLSEVNEEYISSFIKIMDNVKFAEAGLCASYAVKKDGSLWAWGLNTDGQIGHGNIDEAIVNEPVRIMNNVKYVSAFHHVTALKEDGTLWTWGQNSDNHLGILVTSQNDTVDKPVRVMQDVEMVAAGMEYTLALKSDDILYGWGHNPDGELGNGSTLHWMSVISTPVEIIDINDPEKVELDVKIDKTVQKKKGNVIFEIEVTNIGKVSAKDIHFYLETTDCMDNGLLAVEESGMPISTATKSGEGYLFNTKRNLNRGESFYINFAIECTKQDKTSGNECEEKHYSTIKFFASGKEVFSEKASFSFKENTIVEKSDEENEGDKKEEKKTKTFYEQQIADFRDDLRNKVVTKENKAEVLFLIEKFIVEGEKIPGISIEMTNVRNQYRIYKLMDFASETIATYDEIEGLPGTIKDIISGNFAKLIRDEAVNYFIKNKIKDRADNIVADSVKQLLDYIANYDHMWKEITNWYLEENGFRNN